MLFRADFIIKILIFVTFSYKIYSSIDIVLTVALCTIVIPLWGEAEAFGDCTALEVVRKMLKKSYYDKADAIIAEHGTEQSALIPIIQDIQAAYRYLPLELLSYVAEKLGINEAKAYSVATFYENFSFEPKGKYVIKVCDGTACHVRGSNPILERLYVELGLSHDKKTTDDMLFTLETVSCLGACGLAPVMTINDKVYPAMTPDTAAAIIEELRG